MKKQEVFLHSAGVGIILGMIFLALFCFGVFAYLLLVLWNWLVPALFSGPVISFWQACGLLLLLDLLAVPFLRRGT